MSQLLEIRGQKGRLAVVEELGHVFALIPYTKKLAPAAVREVREQTLDFWRYVQGVGLVLDLTIWREESGLLPEDIKNRVENKYKDILDKIFEILEKSSTVSKKKKKRKKKKSRKKRRT
ncbi:MAG: hypothetical protein ACK4SY_06635 [Pyrobaculum sp.]